MIKQYPTHAIAHVANPPLTPAADRRASRLRPSPSEPGHSIHCSRSADRRRPARGGYALGIWLWAALVATGYAPDALAASAWVSFKADRTRIASGQTVLLSWASANVWNCSANGAWWGSRATSGYFRTKVLTADTTYHLTCQSARGAVRRSVFVDVVSTTPPVTPTLTLQSSSRAVRSGESVTLTWAGQAVTNCQASGAWTGTRPASGTEVRSQLTTHQSYTLSCDSASGRIVAMTSVQITSGGTEITWSPPTRNDDGTPLTDLAAYRIHVGTISRSYHQQVDVSDPAATRHFLELQPGEYYIAMTALDAEGNESALSNEVRKVVQ